MALRDQPYLPLYVQDVLTDEKLIECSANSHGVYFRLLCILHKQKTYGLLCLKQKYKQSDKQIKNFASMLDRQMPFDIDIIKNALTELIEENVIQLDGDNLIQKRMYRDGQLSIIRAESGKKGGSTLSKQYGKQGYLYFMSDFDKINKIGISSNPKNRLYRLRSDNKIKNFELIKFIKVKNMGKSEDLIIDYFSDIIDGEWLKDSYDNILKRFVLFEAKLKAKVQANTENESEDEIEIENKYKYKKEMFIEKNPDSLKIVQHFIKTLESDNRYIPKTDAQKLEWLKVAQWSINQMGKNGVAKVTDIIDYFRNGSADNDNFSWNENWQSLKKLQNKNKDGVTYLDYFWEKAKTKFEYKK